MAGAAYATLWEFMVAAGRQPEFEAHYGPEGSWARLFRRADGYLGSELLRDRADPLHYLTIDRWRTRDAWLAFRREHAAEYERLDREFAALTTREGALGEFTPAGRGGPT
jgi:heme-degrading monooxygenase HmoA